MKTRRCPWCSKDVKCGFHNSEEITDMVNRETEGQYNTKNISDREFNRILEELDAE